MRYLTGLFVLALAILFVQLLTAQTTFGPQQVLMQSDVYKPTSVYTADIDTDGLLDIVVSHSDGNVVSWFKNIGSNNFAHAQVLIPEFINGLTITDLDGDGDLDILGMVYNLVKWFLNNGSGSFGIAQTKLLPNNIWSIKSADFDLDGDNDILLATINQLVWLPNNGGGNFGAVQQMVSVQPTSTRFVDMADVNNDGYLDIVAGLDDNRLVWYANDGSGGYGTKQLIGEPLYELSYIGTADLDSDGDNDILITYKVLQDFLTTTRLAWLPNDGSNYFEPVQDIYAPIFGYNVSSEVNNVQVLDYDSDGDLDIVFAFYTSYFSDHLVKMKMSINNGSGLFTTSTSYEIDCNLLNFHIADYNADGLWDIVRSISIDDYVGIKYGAYPEVPLTYPPCFGLIHLYGADLNHDNLQDWVSLNYNIEAPLFNYLTYYLQTETGGYTTFKVQDPNSTCIDFFYLQPVKILYVGKFDNDDFTDLITLNFDGEVMLYKGSVSTNGYYYVDDVVSLGITFSNNAYDIRFSDLNNDGAVDIVSIDETGFFFSVFLNDGNGNFDINYSFSSFDNNNLLIEDYDNNGLKDIGVISGNLLTWHVNTGEGFQISPTIILPISTEVETYVIDNADFDGDGYIDILLKQNNGLAWLPGDGTGNFGTPVDIIGGDYVAQIGDIDHDGDEDIICTSSNIVFFSENQGNGIFNPIQQIISDLDSYTTSLYLADMEGDGDLDIVSSSTFNDNIFWYENLYLSETDPLPPLAAFTTLPAAAADTLTICQGQPVQFFNQSQNANAFLWNFGNGATSTTANPAFTYTEPGTYEVQLTAYSNLPQTANCQADVGTPQFGIEGVFFGMFGYNNTQAYTFTYMSFNLAGELTGINTNYWALLGYSEDAYVVAVNYLTDSVEPQNTLNGLLQQQADGECIDISIYNKCGLGNWGFNPVYSDLYDGYIIHIFRPVMSGTCVPFSCTIGGYPVIANSDFWLFSLTDIINTNFQPFTPGDTITICPNSFSTGETICCQEVIIPELPPSNSPRPLDDPETLTDTASLIIVVSPGFAPQISCVSTVCQGTVADYGTNADCETYLWEVTGGQILSGQGTPAITIEWTTPPLGSISLSAECGAETCNEPTVAAVPIIGGTVTIEGQTNFCLNEVLQYTAPYFGGTQYQWSIVPAAAGTILTGQGSNLITVQWSATAATLQLTYQNALLDCGGTASLAVQPKPAFAIEPVAPVCEGNTVTITANAAENFVWSVSGGNITSGQNTNQITLLCTASGSITVSAVPVNPADFCNSVAQTNVTVVVYPQTPETITGSAIICPMQTYTYTAAPLQPNTMFVWTIAGGSITAGQNSPTVQVQWNSSGGPYSLSVVRQTLTSPVCISLPAVLSVLAVADSPFTITGAATVCPNTQQTYQINPVLPDAAITWLVNPPDAALLAQGQNSASAVFLFNSNASGGVAVISASYCNLTVELPVNVGAFPMPAITQSDTLCTGSTAQLTVADLISAAPYTAYLWKNSAGEVVGTGAALNISAEGVYTVQVTNTWGCVGLASHRAFQYTSPVAQVLPSGYSYICIQDPENINLLAIDGTNYAFEWLQDGTPISGGTTPFYTHLGNDAAGIFTYQIMVTDTQNTCTVLSEPKIVAQVLCTGGGAPGDTIIPPPPPQCLPVAGYSLNFTLTADPENCNTVTLNAATSGSFSSFSVNWGDGVSEPFNGISATHTYPAEADILQYPVVVQAYYIHPVTGFSCYLSKYKTYILPLVSRFDTEPACAGQDWVFQCRSYYLPTTGITQRTWNFGDGTPPLTGTQTEAHTYTVPGTYTVTLTITNGECVVSSSKTITVAPLPDAGFTVSGGQCVGSSFLFTPNQANLAAYTWQLGNGATAAQPAPNFAYTQAGTYEVSLQVQDNNGCASAVQTQTLTVLEAPEPQPVTATGTVFCEGNFATLTAPEGGAGYLWTNGQTTPQITIGASGNYAVQVTLPDGCFYTTPPVPVQVVPNPPAAISPVSPVHICTGDSITLNTPVNSGYTYVWSLLNNGLPYNTYFNNGNITVTVTDTATGCSATATAQIVVHSAPAAPAIAASATQLCEGENAVLAIDAANPQYNYFWTNGAVGTSITVNTSGNYGATAQNEYGCLSDTSYLVNVQVQSLPDAGAFPSGCYTICPDEVIGVPVNTAQTYEWYFNGVLLTGLTGNTWTPPAEGSYWLVMSNGNCSITTDVLQLEFSDDCPGPLPVTLISFTGSIQPNGNLLQWTTAAEQNAALFTLQASPDGAQFTTLAQLPAAGNSSTARNYAFLDTNPFQLTYYRLLQTDFDGSARQTGEVITLQRTQPTGGFALTHIFPNPTQNTATLTYAVPSAQPVTLLLHDVTGRLLFYATLQPTAGTNNYVLDMSRYPQGLYVVTLNNGAEVVTGKVVRE